MSIYICEKCGAIDNTALGGYWKNCRNHEPKMCSECNTGKWHNEFPKKYWDDEEYGMETILKYEAEGHGVMINATHFLEIIGKLPKSEETSQGDNQCPT